MKRRAANHDESSASYADDNVSNSLDDSNRDRNCGDMGSWCSNNGEKANPIVDIVKSSMQGEKKEGNSAGLFLNQMSHEWDKREKHDQKSLVTAGSRKKKSDKEPPDLTSLIASELTKLSMEDRQKTLEEVHGVVEDIEEDPGEMRKHFDRTKSELKRLRYKHAYEKAAFLSSAYVNDPEFLLSFLRAENYNARLAALRISEHFKHKLELFGEETLVRDIMYDDLNDDEKAILNSGFVQTIPAADRAGRQIVVCNMSEFMKIGTLTNVVRACWYLSVRNAQLNSKISKMGIVGVYIAHGMGNIFEKLYKKNDLVNGTSFMQSALPYKFASVHFCFEDTFGSAIQTYLMMSLGKTARVRLRSHLGSRMECCYALKSFGIDIDLFEANDSVALSDSVKDSVEQCRMLDEYQQKKLETRLVPNPNDVLLGRGRPFQLYSGNIAMSSLIDEQRARYMAARKMDKKMITSEIVKEINRCGGRFLKRVNNKKNATDADWEVVDFETARLKVSHSFRTITKQDDAWKLDSREGIVVDTVPSVLIGSISEEESDPVGLASDSTWSNQDESANEMKSVESSKKRRKG